MEIKVEFEDWKNKVIFVVWEIVFLKEDLEGIISKLKVEVEGWKDCLVMVVG